MVKPTQSGRESSIASCAAGYLSQLEALLDAIRDHLEQGTYAHCLADLGQSAASRFAADMNRISKQEGSLHG